MAAGRVRKSIYKRRRWVLSSVSAYIVPAPRRAHPHLERAERVLDRLAALTHGLRILVETPLLWRDNLDENGAAIRVRSGGRGASRLRRTQTDASPL